MLFGETHNYGSHRVRGREAQVDTWVHSHDRRPSPSVSFDRCGAARIQGVRIRRRATSRRSCLPAVLPAAPASPSLEFQPSLSHRAFSAELGRPSAPFPRRSTSLRLWRRYPIFASIQRSSSAATPSQFYTTPQRSVSLGALDSRIEGGGRCLDVVVGSVRYPAKGNQVVASPWVHLCHGVLHHFPAPANGSIVSYPFISLLLDVVGTRRSQWPIRLS